jgi:hypothetical protein
MTRFGEEETMTRDSQGAAGIERLEASSLASGETNVVLAQAGSPPLQGLTRIDIAGAASGLAPMPSVAQPPLAGNGAHPVSSSAFAGCAHEFARKEAKEAEAAAAGARASRRSAVLAAPSEAASQASTPVATFPAIEHQDTTILDLDFGSAARRALAADKVIERISQLCPQAADCAGPPENRNNDGCRLYECEECDFRACAACMEIHESEPHWSDGATMRERYSTDRVIPLCGIG